MTHIARRIDHAQRSPRVRRGVSTATDVGGYHIDRIRHPDEAFFFFDAMVSLGGNSIVCLSTS
jgi:hypothetical protein